MLGAAKPLAVMRRTMASLSTSCRRNVTTPRLAGDVISHPAVRSVASADWEIASPASLGVVTFHRPGVDSDAMVRRITASGYAAPSTTVLEGRTVARLCTINPRTSEARYRAHRRAPQKLRGGPAHRRPSLLWDRSFSRGWTGQVRAGGRQGSLFGGSVRDADR